MRGDHWMYNIGDLVIYSGHGICKVHEITDQTYAGITRKYYVLQPIENDQQLTINIPVDTDKIYPLVNQEEARELLQSFQSEGAKWINNHQQRARIYADRVNSGNRMEIAKVANTLIRKKIEVEKEGKKFYQQDSKLLASIESILFHELAIALNTSKSKIAEDVIEKVTG